MDVQSIIEEVQSIVSTGTRVPGFKNKVMVDMDRLAELAEDLRNSVPANIQEAQEVINQKESIINQAYLEAQRMKSAAGQEAANIEATAKQEHEAKVDESEVVVTSTARAEEIRDSAMSEAQEIVQDAQRKSYRALNEAESTAGVRRDGSDQYAREVLFNLEELLADTLGQVRRGIDSLSKDEQTQAVGNNVAA